MATLVMVRMVVVVVMALIVVVVVVMVIMVVVVVVLTVTWLAGGGCRPASLGSVPTVSLTGSNHQRRPHNG